MSPVKPLYGKISSSIADLNELSRIYPWIPNEHTIRPTEASLALKRRLMEEVERDWGSIRDYIYHDVYCLPYMTNTHTHKRYVDSVPPNNQEWAFVPSKFRYNLPADANHWVLWNSEGSYSDEYDDATVNTAIILALDSHLGHTDFEYAWYKNPKPTVPHLWHVQVFWKNTSTAAL
jgi:hypothetical protein